MDIEWNGIENQMALGHCDSQSNPLGKSVVIHISMGLLKVR